MNLSNCLAVSEICLDTPGWEVVGWELEMYLELICIQIRTSPDDIHCVLKTCLRTRYSKDTYHLIAVMIEVGHRNTTISGNETISSAFVR